MAPMYLNPAQDHSDPFRLAEAQKRDHQRLQLLHSSSHNRPDASVSRPIFLNSSTQDQGMIKLEGSQQHDQKARTINSITRSNLFFLFNSFVIYAFIIFLKFFYLNNYLNFHDRVPLSIVILHQQC